jgi:hypothetical protein
MNSRENEPLPTSIQAGEPTAASAPIDAEDSIDIPAPSKLDGFLNAIKAHERYGLVAGIGVQMLVLGAMIVLGILKVLDGGVFR